MNVVITISRQLGSNGSYIATEAAKLLDFRYLDREILQRAAERAGYPDAEMVRALAEKERAPSFLDSILDSLGKMTPVPIVPSATLREGQAYSELANSMLAQQTIEEQQRERAAENYGALVERVISNYAESGNVVIAGRGGQVILRHRRNALHVRVVASTETRIRNLVARQELPREEAEEYIRESDRRRARYLQRYHGVSWDDPRLYHLVINTDKVPVPMGTHIVVEAARWLDQSLAEG
ncbi:MAG: AAA family ATPase [Anaerolineae bacterium]